jgi:5-methyltetrahydropteroyltriglutamate--homocysteine methyltransferase
MLARQYEGGEVDSDELERRVQDAVTAVVRRQLDLGIDVVSDGEMGKIGFSQYVRERMTGFDEVGTGVMSIDDLDDFPGVGKRAFPPGAEHGLKLFTCSGPVEVSDPDAIHRDIARFKQALGDAPSFRGFMGAPTPGQLTFNFPNHYYDSHEDYLEAAANAMRHEYKAITEAGLALQVDSPDLAMAAHVRTIGSSVGDFQTHIPLAVEALNHGLDGIPRDMVRLHICWGNYHGPHNRDVPLSDIIRPILRANVGTISFEASNPRHAHEWELFETLVLPDDLKIMPGVIEVTTNRIEHPRLVSQRLTQFSRLVGQGNVIAGTDCGFSTVAGWEHVDPEVCWAKLSSLVEGAQSCG